MQSYQITEKEAGQRLDKFLHRFMPTAQTSFLYKMLRKKNIVLNGKKAEGKESVSVGDVVSFFFSDETYAAFTQNAGTVNILPYEKAYKALKGISVIYENTHILIVNKPSGILTQKADAKDISLNEWIIGYLLATHKLTCADLNAFKPSVQNRLDRNTSGIVLCGISLQGSQLLSRLIRERSVDKYYYAIVTGKVKKASELKGFLIKNATTNKVFVSQEKTPDSSFIHTAIKPLSSGQDISCLEVKLITGKTHQIRAHMASIGHPLLGDGKYGDPKDSINIKYKKACGVSCQLLHAARITFPILNAPFMDISGQTFKAPLPKQFSEVISYGNLEFPWS